MCQYSGPTPAECFLEQSTPYHCVFTPATASSMERKIPVLIRISLEYISYLVLLDKTTTCVPFGNFDGAHLLSTECISWSRSIKDPFFIWFKTENSHVVILVQMFSSLLCSYLRLSSLSPWNLVQIWSFCVQHSMLNRM